MIKDIYIGEYSPNQKCYNICTLKEALSTNKELMESGTFNGYIPLCVGNSYDEVKEQLNELEARYGRPGN